MLSMLPESAARARRSPAGMAWSVFLHLGAALLATTVAGLKRDLESSLPHPTSPDSVVYFVVAPKRPDAGSGTGGRTTREPQAGPVAPSLPTTVQFAFPLLPPNPAAPPLVPVFGTPDADARRVLGSRRSGFGDPRSGDDMHRMPYVERQAVPLPDNPRPRYPDALRAAHIEGVIAVDCVVDTSGVIDLSTVRIFDSDHERFTAAVREVLPRLRFTPAESGGRKVRQWVRIPFEFRLSASRR